MKRYIISLLCVFVSLTANSQLILEDHVIEDIVKNEREYFDGITELFKNDDPMLRIDDIALVYYGQAFLPAYNPGGDENEALLKQVYEAKKYDEAYNIAQKILAYNPVSLNALFNAYIASKKLGKEKEESSSYLKKYYNILDMICKYGDGKSSETAFRIITPDDKDYILYGKLQIESVISSELDTETLCNIVLVKPSRVFPSKRVYFDLSLYLLQATRE